MTSRSSRDPRRELRGVARAQAASLHRTALMLTGDAATADALVLTAFRSLAEAWPAVGAGSTADEVLSDDRPREELVHAYLADARRHRRDRVEASARGDPVDVLSSLSPRQRAAAVLVRVEGWSDERAGRALRTAPGHVLALVPATPGMDAALEALADADARPAHEIVTDLLASLAADAGSAVAQPASEEDGGGSRFPRTMRSPRRGLRRLLAAALVTVGAVAAAALLERGDDDMRAREEVVDDLGSVGSDLTARGWVLDADDDPPAALEDLRLIASTTIDYADPTDPLALDIVPREGNAVFAALWCDIPALDANLTVPTATLTLSGQTVSLPCAGKDGDPAVPTLVPLPPPDRRGPAPVSVSWAGDLPTRGTAVLGTYAEAGEGRAPPIPVVLPDEPPPSAAGTAMLDRDAVRIQVADVAIFLQRVTVSSASRLAVWTGQTGTFMVLVDGVIASDDGDFTWRPPGDLPSPLLWRDQDPELREGSWTVHAPGHVKHYALPEIVRPAPGHSSEVTVTAIVDSGPEGRWQVQITDASLVDLEVSPVHESSTNAPDRARGHRLVGAWEVPMTGYPYPLVASAPLSSDTVFTSISPIAPHVDPPGAGWDREGAITSDLGTASLPSAINTFSAVEAMQFWPGWDASLLGGSRADAEDPTPLGQVSASYLGFSSSVDHVTVLAYEPEP